MTTLRTVYCQARVWPPGAMRSRQCTKPATSDGWCSTHHPAAVEARRAARDARWQAARDASDAKLERQKLAAQDAVRMAWLADHYADVTFARPLELRPVDLSPAQLSRVWEWIAANTLRLGGVRECIDHLMELDTKGSDDANR